MSTSQVKPYGSWESPITPEMVASDVKGFQDLVIESDSLYWLEIRPEEEGRYVIMTCPKGGEPREVLPSPYNARTRVHEYGGAPFLVHRNWVFFSNFSDQRMYRLSSDGGKEPQPITPATDGDLRFADAVYDQSRDRIIAVCEDHRDSAASSPENKIISFTPDPVEENNGSWSMNELATGHDFFSSPSLSPGGDRLLWLSWDHPQMPWDGTELWGAELDQEGIPRETTKLAGGQDESILQPTWSPDGNICYVSDQSGWWYLYSLTDFQSVEPTPLTQRQAEFGKPSWVFGMSTYSFFSEDEVICTYKQEGEWKLARLDLETRALLPLKSKYSQISYLKVGQGRAAFIGGSPTEPFSVVGYNLETDRSTVIQSSRQVNVEQEYFSKPQQVSFSSDSGLTAYGYYYAPQNKDFRGPEEGLPPLIVHSHGGPTASASTVFNLSVQFWTSRGFAYLDVNYGGSSGYGRKYRERLKGQWGLVDVEDCVAGASYLAEEGLVDEDRCLIQGGSAGGFTTLASLTDKDFFQGGASFFGVSNLAALAEKTHKFESRYLEGLIGPYPEDREVYRERSPIEHVDNLDTPVIFLQGLEDQVVPPEQAEQMVDALRQKNIPVAYLTFEEEQHGFRKAENNKRALEAVLYFYLRLLDLEPAEELDPIEIYNEEKLPYIVQ